MDRLATLLLAALALLAGLLPQRAEALFGLGGDEREYIIISGGPALRAWENLRIEDDRHDRWWGNFVRPARVRMEVLRERLGPEARITWLVHRSSYERRAREDGRPLVSFVESVRDLVGCQLVWYETGDDVIRYINKGQRRSKVKISGLEYYGHSNKYCFMFDYSSVISGASKGYLHMEDIRSIKRGVFARDAHVKSWGCHTGEAMSQAWRWHCGVPMIGAVGKTDYSGGYTVVLSPRGSWTR